MPTAFSTVDSDVLAAISGWGGLAALQPRPVVRMLRTYNEIAENLKSFGMRPTIWIMPIASASTPFFTPDSQRVELRYRFYLIAPGLDAVKARDIVYQINAALIQFANWKNPDGTNLAAPSPWVYQKISGPAVLDPSQLSPLEQDLQDVVAVLESSAFITTTHASVMVVPEMTLTAAQITIEAEAVGYVDANQPVSTWIYSHVANQLVLNCESKPPGVPQRVDYGWWRFPIGGLSDAVEITGLTLQYTVTAAGRSDVFSYQLSMADPSAASAQALYLELRDGLGITALTTGSTGAKSIALDASEAEALLLAIQGGESKFAIGAAFVLDGNQEYASATLSPTLSLNKIVVDYTHYV